MFAFFACKGKPALDSCADENALNFHEEATTNTDCRYTAIDINPRLLTNLSDELNESSGLALIDGHLITHNDKNNPNKLYVINPSSGSVAGRITVKGMENNDWEDLAQNDESLFVGDMGNNDGDRQNLQIYKISKSKLQFEGESEVAPEAVISFRYPTQKSFSPNKEHNFDAEALLYHKGFLYLFSKNRTDAKSSLYRIPAQEGSYDAELIATFDVGGRITGAAMNSEGQVALLGLDKNVDCFLWLLDSYKGDNFFSGNKTFINLGPFKYIGQTEGIIYSEPRQLYISSEKANELPARLYSVDLP